MVNFILRMAAIFDGRKDQLVFLINNYDLVLSVYNERSAASEAEKADFEKQVQVCYSGYGGCIFSCTSWSVAL